MTWLLVVVVLLCLFGSYVLAAADMAFRRMSTSHVKTLVDENRRGSEALRAITEDSAAYLSVTTFTRVTLEMTAAVLATMGFATVYGAAWQTYVFSIGVMVVASFVIVGVSPGTLGIQHAETISLWAAPGVVRLRKVLSPLARALIAVGNAVTPGKGYRDGPFESEAELRDLVDLAGESSIIAEGERSMLHSVIDLGGTVTREVMVPRPDMITISKHKNLSQAMSLFLRSGFSRVPVIGDSSDDPLGLLYFKDVTGLLQGEQDARWLPVTDCMRPVPFVPESKPADTLLREMQRDQTHMAIVVDEYGGTAGLVTIEDIIEEIVGEISDEHDPEERRVEPIDDERYRVPAETAIDDLAELFGVTFEEDDVDDVDTVGGLLAKALGRVPILGASAVVGGVELTADRMAGRKHRIDSIVAHRVTADELAEHEAGATCDEGDADEAVGGAHAAGHGEHEMLFEPDTDLMQRVDGAADRGEPTVGLPENGEDDPAEQDEEVAADGARVEAHSADDVSTTPDTSRAGDVAGATVVGAQAPAPASDARSGGVQVENIAGDLDDMPATTVIDAPGGAHAASRGRH